MNHNLHLMYLGLNLLVVVVLHEQNPSIVLKILAVAQCIALGLVLNKILKDDNDKGGYA